MFDNFEDFEPLYFLNFSKQLLECSNCFEVNETTIKRIVYGRIYYATFLYVREWLKMNWQYNSTKRDNTQMLNFIRSRGPFNRVLNHKIRDDLFLLKSLRHQVDYYITIPREGEIGGDAVWYDESIETAFELADFIIEKFDEYEFDN
ncbi:MAG: hypothetical protein IJL02_05610 [Methanobrevibacter sp.]|uniref:hypothetical protein n=1 Tax=Methanobrevibacter sp. TaxID=66852 RepID=UPI0025CD598E|nr:hypothetical protein [Methanobrevibacter sp.]MBQ6099324.1 hypothetical protein [Methanobrevibacter sp.]